MISKRIKERRLQLNMTQEELAQKVGYKTKGAISRIEKGERDISQTQISDFAKALNTSESYLMGWTDDIFDNRLPGQHLGSLTQSEKQLLKNYNSTNEKGKKRIMTTSEEMVELYPIIDRDEILNFFSDNDMQTAALSCKNLNDRSDEELHTLYRLLKNE